MLIEKRKDREKGIKEITIKINKLLILLFSIIFGFQKKEEYKNSKNYKIFIQKNNIVLPKDMINLLNRILFKYKVNFLDEDSSKFSKKITTKISRY